MCSCNDTRPNASDPQIITADLAQLRSAAPARKGAMAQGHVTEYLHTLQSGETLMSAAIAGDREGTVILHGSIGPFAYEIEVGVRLEESGELVVRLHVRKPFEIGPYELRFNLTGVVRNSANQIVGATGVAPVSAAYPMAPGFWCVLRCGGAAIIGVLIQCLPALVGGPKGYIACVVAKLGGSAAKVAECIAQKCM